LSFDRSAGAVKLGAKRNEKTEICGFLPMEILIDSPPFKFCCYTARVRDAPAFQKTIKCASHFSKNNDSICRVFNYQKTAFAFQQSISKKEKIRKMSN
jgi:hypothetical protein